MRPDQHAFEKGTFEHANNLKSELEEHQRATRRKREQGQLPPHKPRWFRHSKDADTGESYWEPAQDPDGKLEYWTERERVGKAKLNGEKLEWKDVDPICKCCFGRRAQMPLKLTLGLFHVQLATFSHDQQ